VLHSWAFIGKRTTAQNVFLLLDFPHSRENCRGGIQCFLKRKIAHISLPRGKTLDRPEREKGTVWEELTTPFQRLGNGEFNLGAGADLKFKETTI